MGDDYYTAMTPEGPVTCYQVIIEYQFGFFGFTPAHMQAFYFGNVIKYLFRLGHKSVAIESDFNKAIDYAKRLGKWTYTKPLYVSTLVNSFVDCELQSPKVTGRRLIAMLREVQLDQWVSVMEAHREEICNPTETLDDIFRDHTPGIT